MMRPKLEVSPYGTLTGMIEAINVRAVRTSTRRSINQKSSNQPIKKKLTAVTIERKPRQAPRRVA